jgi:hypothetical protein
MRVIKLAIGCVFFGVYLVPWTSVKGADGLQSSEDSSFKSSLAEECLRIQMAAIENSRLPTSTLRKYCECVAEDLPDLLTSDEMKSLATDEQLPSVTKKQKIVGDHCIMSTLGR